MLGMLLLLEELTCSHAAGKGKQLGSQLASISILLGALRPTGPAPRPVRERLSWPIVVWVVPLLAASLPPWAFYLGIVWRKKRACD